MKKFKVYAAKKDIRSKAVTTLRRIVAASLDDYEQEQDILGNYLPPRGEGETMASQIATAVNKLVYKWWNDGDVYDNNYGMEGWANDLSSYANWLYRYVPVTKSILEGIYHCNTEQEYETILCKLLAATSDAEDLENWEKQLRIGSVYDCSGPFSWRDPADDEEEDGYYEEDYEEDEGEDW